MPTADAPIVLSDASKEFTGKERQTTIERVESLQKEVDVVRALGERLETELARARATLGQMDELLGLSSQTSIEDLSGELHGRRIAQVAVQVLRERGRPEEPIHYRAWMELLEEAGVTIAGRNPLATLLTELTRAPEVESVKPRSGLYKLRRIRSASPAEAVAAGDHSA